VTDVRHSNGDAAPRTAEGSAGEDAGGGVSRENVEIANAKFCILMHFHPSPPPFTLMDGSHALFDGQETPRELGLPIKIGACGKLDFKRLNISMYVVCIHCIRQLYIDSVIVTNKYKLQINVLAVVTKFIIIAQMLLLAC